jgi:hypothetical protein
VSSYLGSGKTITGNQCQFHMGDPDENGEVTIQRLILTQRFIPDGKGGQILVNLSPEEMEAERRTGNWSIAVPVSALKEISLSLFSVAKMYDPGILQ